MHQRVFRVEKIPGAGKVLGSSPPGQAYPICVAREDLWTTTPSPTNPKRQDRVNAQHIREILKRNAGNDARAREEVNELLTKMKAAAERSN